QELNHEVLAEVSQAKEEEDARILGLAMMPIDGVAEGVRLAVVHEAGALIALQADAPERRRPHQPAGGVVLGDTVAGRAHVVEQEVAERPEQLVAQRRNPGHCRGSVELEAVAVAAADEVEQLLAYPLGVADEAARRLVEEAHEVGELIDVFAVVVEVRSGIAAERMAESGRAVA